VWIDPDVWAERAAAIMARSNGLLKDVNGKPTITVSAQEFLGKDSDMIACEVECRRDGIDGLFVELDIPGLDALLGDGVDVLFCYLEEAHGWCGSADLNVAKQALQKLAKMVCLTRGPDGSEIITAENSWHVPADKVKAIDTNGAGDMFAGAFLYAMTRGYSPEKAANLGNHAAAAVVSQHGNRLTLGQLSIIKAYALPALK
jgi:hypothetical protein